MKDYYYMFSSGSYSDYCVGGMYKSKLDLSEEDFTDYRKKMVYEALVDYPVEFQNEVAEKSCTYSRHEAIAEYHLGEHPRFPNYCYADHSIRTDYLGKAREYNLAKESVLGALKLDLLKYLAENGILEYVEYSEMHEVE